MKHALPLALTASILALAGGAAAYTWTPAQPNVDVVDGTDNVGGEAINAEDDGLSVPGSDLREERDERSTDLLAVDLVDDASDADIAALEAKYGIKLEDNSPDVQNDSKVDVVRLSARVLSGTGGEASGMNAMAALIEALAATPAQIELTPDPVKRLRLARENVTSGLQNLLKIALLSA